MTGRLFLAGGSLLGLFCFVVSAEAAPPQITKLAAYTLQPNATTTLVIDGTDLAPNPRILLPIPIAAQEVKPGATATKIQVDVKLAADVPPGIYQMRLASDKGISNPVGIEIDDLPQRPFAAQVAELPVVLNGTLGGSATLATVLTGKKGQRLVIEVEARRLGSIIDPVVKLLDPKRLQVAWAQGSAALSGDTRLTTVLPADGQYTIELHDLQYRAGTPSRFRLKLGDVHHADLAFPLAGRRGTRAAFELIGSRPNNTRVEADLTTAIAGSLQVLPRVAGLSGSSPRILISDIPEIVEVEQPAGKIQEVAVPVGISGRLAVAKEEDRYRVPVQPGMKLRFDVLAERLGSPLDGVLILRNEAGAQLARSDDQPGTLDPGLEFTVPAGVTALVAAVSDAHGRGGPNFIYRLAITPVDQPDFALVLPPEDRFHIPRNGSLVVRVQATRTGYAGPIKLTLPGLPEGVTVAGDEIPAGATNTLLSLTAAEGANLAQALLRIVGESTEPAVPLQRLALLPETPLSRALPWLRADLAVAVTDPGPILIAWETPPASLPAGANAAAKVKVTRLPGTKGTIRLTLLTSQIVPKTKDLKDDIVRSLRLEGTPTVAEDQTMAELKLVVPADLPSLPYDLAIRADLLSADGKMVLATTFTSGLRLVAAK